MQLPSTSTRIMLHVILCHMTLIMAKNAFSAEELDRFESCKIGYQTNDWSDCAYQLSTHIWNTHTWYDDEPMHLCQLKCTHQVKGRVSNFRWVWDATFQCPARAPGISGEAHGFQIRRNALKQAIADMIEKAIDAGELTPNDFQCD